jgi:hypothetical protein
MSTAIAQQKIRIRLKAFDRRMLDLSCDKIIETADNTAATAIGPIRCQRSARFTAFCARPTWIRIHASTLKRGPIDASSIFTALLQRPSML